MDIPYIDPFTSVLSTVEAQKIILKILRQCFAASDKELHMMLGAIDNVYTAQQDTWQAFDPIAMKEIITFIDKFWDESKSIKVKICCDLVYMNNIKSRIALLTSNLNFETDETRGYVSTTANSMESCEYKAESVFMRFNTIISICGEYIGEEGKKLIYKLRDNIPLSYSNRLHLDPMFNILDKFFGILPEYWKTSVYRRWLDELITDYRGIFLSGNDL